MTSTKTGQPPQFSGGGGGGGGIKGALGELLDNDEVKAKLAKVGKRKLAGLLGKLVGAIADLLDGDDDDEDDDKAKAEQAGGQAQQPGTSPAPAPTPSPVPPQAPELRRIEGGRAHLTGIHERGPQGPPLTGERLREVRDRGANGPSDGWYAFDCTPKVQGEDLGPMPEREARSGKQYDRQVNPAAQGILAWDESTTAGDSGGHQVVRLVWDEELTAGSAELVHEGGNHGCTPRIKTVGARGKLRNLRFIAAGGVVIPCEPANLNIGRQE